MICERALRSIRGSVTILSLLLATSIAAAGSVTYLANEGVLVSEGETSILFDPLFDNGFGRYELLPADTERRLFAGEPPFIGVDAVFISHYHGDHFSPEKMLAYLRAQPDVRLFAPAQAIAALRAAAGDDDATLFERATGIAMDNGDEAVSIDLGSLDVSVLRVPHSGWPDRRTDVENLVFTVTLEDSITVAHFGDADANTGHFQPHAQVWESQPTDLAMPPYWFFLPGDGRQILNNVVQPAGAIGIHVPTDMPDNPTARPAEIRAFDLFTEPGETRDLP